MYSIASNGFSLGHPHVFARFDIKHYILVIEIKLFRQHIFDILVPFANSCFYWGQSVTNPHKPTIATAQKEVD